jgi:hypothetical protein
MNNFNINKKDYSIYLNLFFFLFFCLFGIEPTLCENTDFYHEESLSSNESNLDKENENTSNNYKKIIIIGGLIILISISIWYFTGEGFNNDIDDVDTIVETVTNVIKDVQISEKRTEAERRAFMKAFHVGLQIPSWW